MTYYFEFGTTRLFKQVVRNMAEYLDISNPSKGVYVYFVHYIDENTTGAIDDRGTHYVIHILRSLPLEERVMTLAHELVHLKQFEEKRLKVSYGYRAYWCGKLYHYQNSVWKDRPWEIEATYMQHLVVENYLNSLKNPIPHTPWYTDLWNMIIGNGSQPKQLAKVKFIV